MKEIPNEMFCFFSQLYNCPFVCDFLLHLLHHVRMQMMSCLVMPLSSHVVCKEGWSSVAQAGSAARHQQSSDWTAESHPSDTGHVPPGKQPLLHATLNSRNTVEDITAATLSSTNP